MILEAWMSAGHGCATAENGQIAVEAAGDNAST
jgi:hypothetical protein